MLGRPTALPAADLESDALARTLRHTNPLSTISEGNHVIDGNDIRWIEFLGNESLGVNANMTSSDPLDRYDTRRFVFATATNAGMYDSSKDYFGLISMFEETADRREQESPQLANWSIMGYYSIEITPTLRFQPSLGWSGEADSSDLQFRGLLGLKLTF